MNLRKACGNWRNHAWAWYLGVTGVLTAAYLFFPPLAGNGPLINFLGLTGVVAIVAGIRINKPKARAAWPLVWPLSRSGALRARASSDGSTSRRRSPRAMCPKD